DGAERRLLRRELMAVVAAAVVGPGRLVAPSEAAAALRDALAALPVADEVAGREGDGLHLVGFERLGELGRRLVVRLVAHALQRVGRHPVHGRLAARLEVALHNLFYVLPLHRDGRTRA